MHAMDPILLDRELQQAARTAKVWLRNLRLTPDDQDFPLQRLRSLLGKARFDEVGALPEHDPLRAPLQRCIYRYAELRINQAWLTHSAVLRYSELYEVQEPVRDRATANVMFKSALSEELRRKAWLKSFLSVSGPSAEAQVTLWQRRQEIAKRLELESPDALELPIERTELESQARTWLSRTQPMAEEFCRDEFADWLGLALGVDATEGWPASLNERSIARWFHKTRLLEDLPIDTPPMPEAYGASSYLRALSELGFAVREAGAPGHQPFCIAHDPFGLESHGLGVCFARLLASPTFVIRNLGLSSKLTQDHLRTIGRVLLLESRNRAAKILLRWPALEGEHQLREAYPSLIHSVLGCSLSDKALGLLLTPGTGDPTSFCGLFLGEARFSRYTEEHDEDWFRNPRAVDELRSELKLPPSTVANADELQHGADLLHSRLCDWL